MKLFLEGNTAALEMGLIMRELLGQKRETLSLEETAKPIKNVLVPFLIILEKNK